VMGTSIQLSEEESPTFARWIDVSSIELAESGPTWIQAFPYNTYEHPVHGKLEFNQQRAMQFAANVKANVRGQDLDIDYDHKMLRSDAAGWVRDAEARQDGLWILVEWTSEALTKLKDKAYRYFSPEYVDKWKNPATGAVHNDVLFGGALTNRPFLKGILPINLSEMIGEESNNQGAEGGNQVNREQLEQLAQNLGVSFEASTSDEDLFTAVSEVKIEPPKEEQKQVEETKDPIAASEDLVKLAETNPAVALLLSDREEQRKRLATLEASARLGNINTKLAEMNGQGHALKPVIAEKVRKAVVQLSERDADSVLDLIAEIVSDGVVELGERGSGAPATRSGGKTFAEEFEGRANKLMEANKDLDYADAVTQVAADDPELFESYRHESYLKEGA
jgi:phage I-like protein